MIRIRPSRIIGENYLSRWHIIPRNPWFNIYLHKFSGSDDDRALHDHPWWSVSFLLKGRLVEHYDEPRRLYPKRLVRIVPRWLPVFRRAEFAHRLELVREPAWTLFITGPRRREWGFHCSDRWVHWRNFTDASGNKIGRGCD